LEDETMDKHRVVGSVGAIQLRSRQNLSMQKTLGVALASILFATSVIATSASAQPRDRALFERQDRVIWNYCRNNWDDDCRDWDHNRHHWDESRYQRWYRDHHRHRGFNPEDAAAALFGFAASMMGSALTSGATNSHVAACQRRFRSYNPSSDTYLGYDGMRHYCRL